MKVFAFAIYTCGMLTYLGMMLMESGVAQSASGLLVIGERSCQVLAGIVALDFLRLVFLILLMLGVGLLLTMFSAPEGVYLIDRHKEASAFYCAPHISYPDGNDVARAEKKGLSAGSDIMIHGLPSSRGRTGRRSKFDYDAGRDFAPCL
ncbi:MAG: hypothetical protein ACR2II_13440 [Chthoniobacterales bacterium]